MIPKILGSKGRHSLKGPVKQSKGEKVMAARTLVKDAKKFGGQYVATRSFKNKKILCAGTDPVEVIQEAKKLGAKDPVLIFVPKEGVVHIY
jgi:hypothetical protein